MDKSKWYYENARTGEITDIKDAVDWWVADGDRVHYWRWSECCQEWLIMMTREA